MVERRPVFTVYCQRSSDKFADGSVAVDKKPAIVRTRDKVIKRRLLCHSTWRELFHQERISGNEQGDAG